MKSKSMLLLVLPLLCLILAACSTGAKFQPDDVFNTKGTKLYVYRNKGFTGILVGENVYLDGQLIGKLRNGQYLSVPLNPGIHVIKTEDESEIFSTRYISREFYVQPNRNSFIRFGFAYLGKTQMFSGTADTGFVPSVVPTPSVVINQVPQSVAMQELSGLSSVN